MRKETTEDHGADGKGWCWQLWHEGLMDSPFCTKDIGHEGDHEGSGIIWPTEPQVDAAKAVEFLHYYRRVPNTNHAIVLNDDGTVTMTLQAFNSVTRFINSTACDDTD